ncbi:ABC transporter ATP-binding protein, partial [Georgenia sp. 10Sc9-8]|nr:ABC transporter ATP-binding protein [Georgenia halotolerans]
FYGYTAFLAQPLRAATQFLQFLTRARVAARKVTRVLSVQPAAGTLAESERADAPAHARSTTPTTPSPAQLRDEASGVVVRPGTLTALVAERPEEAAALARRLGRLDDAHADGVRLDGVPVLTLPVAEVRRRVVVSDATPELFTGPLRTELDVRGDAD